MTSGNWKGQVLPTGGVGAPSTPWHNRLLPIWHEEKWRPNRSIVAIRPYFQKSHSPCQRLNGFLWILSFVTYIKYSELSSHCSFIIFQLSTSFNLLWVSLLKSQANKSYFGFGPPQAPWVSLNQLSSLRPCIRMIPGDKLQKRRMIMPLDDIMLFTKRYF